MNKLKLPINSITSTVWVKTDCMLAQFNTKRYHLYASLFDKKRKPLEILNMKISPMYEFIRDYVKCKNTGVKYEWSETQYYKMQRLYGRSHSFAISKASGFIGIYDSIIKIGVHEPPLVVKDDGKFYQIVDGHHRVACCMVLGHKQIICKVLEKQI